jgi:hypothetical protein
MIAKVAAHTKIAKGMKRAEKSLIWGRVSVGKYSLRSLVVNSSLKWIDIARQMIVQRSTVAKNC